MTKRMSMVGWYDPMRLLQTGVRVAISSVFGRFYDRREALAAANEIRPAELDKSYDYSNEPVDEFWIDFMADTGDGWNSTYAMSRLLAEKSLPLGKDGQALKRAKVVVLGGDEVYPTPSREAYDDRLISAMDLAAVGDDGKTAKWAEKDRPHLYAVPGNHDWYDGLSAFFGLFCRRRIKPKDEIGFERPGRVIGGRSTNQTRSYFALKLPGNWWLWAADSQLAGFIDQPQIEYFEHVARYWMAPGSKLILCAATPTWEYVDPKKPTEAFSNFSYLERLAGAAVGEDRKPLGHKLRLILTGDSHHYARITERDRHYITSGGGGAFLHPTHHVEQSKTFDWSYPEPGVSYDAATSPKVFKRTFTLARKSGSDDEALFPSRRESFWLTFGNLLFAFRNWKFTALLAGAYSTFGWLLDRNARLFAGGPLAPLLAHASYRAGFIDYWRMVAAAPATLVLALVASAGYWAFADDRKGPLVKAALGLVHAALQAAVVSLLFVLVARQSSGLSGDFGKHAVPLIAAALITSIASASTFGLYLIASLNVLKLHWNEAFSALAHQGYKGFVRMKIHKSGKLTIYPIGLRKVPKDAARKVKNPVLHPELIEPEIEIE